jgi:hypothetical protein
LNFRKWGSLGNVPQNCTLNNKNLIFHTINPLSRVKIILVPE